MSCTVSLTFYVYIIVEPDEGGGARTFIPAKLFQAEKANFYLNIQYPDSTC